jgi:hypothetical protein
MYVKVCVEKRNKQNKNIKETWVRFPHNINQNTKRYDEQTQREWLS